MQTDKSEHSELCQQLKEVFNMQAYSQSQDDLQTILDFAKLKLRLHAPKSVVDADFESFLNTSLPSTSASTEWGRIKTQSQVTMDGIIQLKELATEGYKTTRSKTVKGHCNETKSESLVELKEVQQKYEELEKQLKQMADEKSIADMKLQEQEFHIDQQFEIIQDYSNQIVEHQEREQLQNQRILDLEAQVQKLLDNKYKDSMIMMETLGQQEADQMETISMSQQSNSISNNSQTNVSNDGSINYLKKDIDLINEQFDALGMNMIDAQNSFKSSKSFSNCDSPSISNCDSQSEHWDYEQISQYDIDKQIDEEEMQKFEHLYDSPCRKESEPLCNVSKLSSEKASEGSPCQVIEKLLDCQQKFSDEPENAKSIQQFKSSDNEIIDDTKIVNQINDRLKQKENLIQQIKSIQDKQQDWITKIDQIKQDISKEVQTQEKLQATHQKVKQEFNEIRNDKPFEFVPKGKKCNKSKQIQQIEQLRRQIKMKKEQLKEVTDQNSQYLAQFK